MSMRPRILLALLHLLALASHGLADLIDHSASITVLNTPPVSVEAGDLTSETEIFLFKERSHVRLVNPIRVNISLPGDSPTADAKNFSPFDIPIGTHVDSYFVHINTPNGSGLERFQGTLTFDQDILGICVIEQTLDPSDSVLGLPNTDYPNPPNGFRGLEFGFGDGAAPDTIDFISLSSDLRTIEFRTRTRGLDQFRVITAVPEASPVVMLSAASLAMLAFSVIRQNRRSVRQTN